MWRKATILILILCAFIGGIWISDWTRNHNQQLGLIIDGLYVAYEDLYPSMVWEDRKTIVKIPIRNVTDQPIHVARFTTSCNCTAVKPDSVTIAAKETLFVNLEVDTVFRQAHHLGASERRIAIEIFPHIDGAEQSGQTSWQGELQVRSRVTANRLALMFGNRVLQDGPPCQGILHLQVHVPIQRVEAELIPNIGTIQIVPGPETGEYVVSVTPFGNLDLGFFESDLLIRLVDLNGEDLSGTIVKVNGFVQTPIIPIPNHVFVGEIELGRKFSQEICLENRGQSNEWTIGKIRSSSSELSIEDMQTESDGKKIRLRVGQTPNQEGYQQTSIQVEVRKKNNITRNLEIPVTYVGIKTKESNME